MKTEWKHVRSIDVRCEAKTVLKVASVLSLISSPPAERCGTKKKLFWFRFAFLEFKNSDAKKKEISMNGSQLEWRVD